MNAAEQPRDRPSDEAFLDDAFDRIVRLLEDGLDPQADALLDGREDLRARVEELIRVAHEVAPASPDALPRISGFQVLQELGHGGMGAVYLARQETLGGRPVALKVLPASATLSARARERFLSEARAIAKLRHPHVVAIHDVLHEDGLYAYAMEWVDGGTLAEWIAGRSSEGTSTSVAVESVPFVCRVGIAVARALSAVHAAGLLHRDVKPSNILLRRDGTPLLSDFGLVREADSSLTVSQVGRFAGTVSYAAPEQLRGEAVDARSDIYALGVTLYHALALRLPFEAREPLAMLRRIEAGLALPLRKFNPRVPRDLETIVAKAMDADPARRYQTSGELADDLERLLAFQPIRARRAGPAVRTLKFMRRNRAAAVGTLLGGVATLALAAAVVTYVFFVPRWVARHVRDARLALLDPGQANNIVSTLYWGRINPYSAQQLEVRRRVFDRAIASYDAALRWAPFDEQIRTERAVVSAAREATAHSHPSRSRVAWGTRLVAPSLRDEGLYAFLTSDYPTAIETWSAWEQSRDPLAEPDALVDAALGILYLFDDQAPRAYPRLQQAVIAFPNVGFLLEYLADAAVKCGDVERAEKWLDEARRLERRDEQGAQLRIRAAILARQGRDAEAEAIFQCLAANTPAGLEYARFLESRGRLEEAVVQFAMCANQMPGDRVARAFVSAADRWWDSLADRHRLRRIRRALDESPSASESFLSVLRSYRTCVAVGAGANQSSDPGANPPPSSRHRFVTSLLLQLFSPLFSPNSSPSLQSCSLSELAERMEVDDMSLWNRMASYPRIVKDLHLATWRWPVLRPGTRSIDYVGASLSRSVAELRLRNARRRAVALATLALGVAASQNADGQCTTPPCFQGLGDLPGGAVNSYVFEISADGSTLVGRSPSANGTEAFRWNAIDGMVGMGDLAGGAFYSEARGVSGDGSIITGYSSSANGDRDAFRWTAQGGMVSIGDLPGGPFGSEGDEVSVDGTTIVGNSDAMAFRWTQADGMIGLGFIVGGNSSEARGVSLDGSVIVGHSTSVNAPTWPPFNEAFRWTQAGGMIGLGFLPGGAPLSDGTSVSGDGSIVVGYSSSSNGVYEAYRWTQMSGMVSIGDLPGGSFASIARDVSPDGSMIVGFGTSSIGSEAAIWDESPAAQRVVDVIAANGVIVPAGWVLTDATGIAINNSVVSICGYGINPQNNPEAWLARYTLSAPCEAPQVSQHPQSANPAPGANVNLNVTATGTSPLSYQWRKGGANLNDGASGCSSTISGATTATLTITNVSTTDNAVYDCVVTNACGSDTSDPATLTVPPGAAVPGDMDGNGAVNGDDIQDFVAALLTP